MSKSFRYFRKSTPNGGVSKEDDTNSGNHYKYSVYMQSKDSTWLNRNINNRYEPDEDPEPIEEDIRD